MHLPWELGAYSWGAGSLQESKHPGAEVAPVCALGRGVLEDGSDSVGSQFHVDNQ